MPEKKTEPAGRVLRADARRNREALVAAARAMFGEKGNAASLDEIARRANVGIGTLYRHFPTRDALVEEVYRSANRQLAEAAEALSEREPPVEALRQWLLLFVDHLATKKLLADALAGMIGGPDALYADSTALLKTAIARLVERAEASGEIKSDVEPLDLLRALAGVANSAPHGKWADSARRLVDILIAGVRTG